MTEDVKIVKILLYGVNHMCVIIIHNLLFVIKDNISKEEEM